MPQLTKKRMAGPQFIFVVQNDNENVSHLLPDCSYSKLIWVRCAALFRLHIDTSDDTGVWLRLQGRIGGQGLTVIVVVAIC